MVPPLTELIGARCPSEARAPMSLEGDTVKVTRRQWRQATPVVEVVVQRFAELHREGDTKRDDRRPS